MIAEKNVKEKLFFQKTTFSPLISVFMILECVNLLSVNVHRNCDDVMFGGKISMTNEVCFVCVCLPIMYIKKSREKRNSINLVPNPCHSLEILSLWNWLKSLHVIIINIFVLRSCMSNWEDLLSALRGEWKRFRSVTLISMPSFRQGKLCDIPWNFSSLARICILVWSTWIQATLSVCVFLQWGCPLGRAWQDVWDRTTATRSEGKLDLGEGDGLVENLSVLLTRRCGVSEISRALKYIDRTLWFWSWTCPSGYPHSHALLGYPHGQAC